MIGITFAHFCNKTDRIYLVDEKFYMKCYDVKSMCETIRNYVIEGKQMKK